MNVTGRTALVTGAGRGIGRAIALALAADGFLVVCAGRDAEALEATAAAIRDAAGEARTATCDVTDPTAVAALRDAAGPVDALVCNSGVAGPDMPFWTVDPAAWAATLDVNATGVFLAARAFVPAMIERGAGAVVAVGSVSGERPLPGRAAYAASKTALTGLVRAMAVDAGPHGVRVNLVTPGPTAGPRFDAVIRDQAASRGVDEAEVRQEFLGRTPLGRIAEPADVAAAVSYLVSDRALAVTGAELNVSAGMVMS